MKVLVYGIIYLDKKFNTPLKLLLEMTKIQPIINKEIAEKAIPLIENAKKTIEVIVYEWRWYPGEIGTNIQQFNNAIINAAKKNVSIRVITQPDSTRKILKENGVQVKEFQSRKKIHTKLMIIDSQIIIIGSHNYTKNAFNLNEEVSLITNEPEMVKRSKQYFENIWEI